MINVKASCQNSSSEVGESGQIQGILKVEQSKSGDELFVGCEKRQDMNIWGPNKLDVS